MFMWELYLYGLQLSLPDEWGNLGQGVQFPTTFCLLVGEDAMLHQLEHEQATELEMMVQVQSAEPLRSMGRSPPFT